MAAGETHPDLVEIDAAIGQGFLRVLEAEQRAAAVAARRTAAFWERLVEWEDQGVELEAVTVDGTRLRGRVAAVGSDHLELSGTEGSWVVRLEWLAWVGVI